MLSISGYKLVEELYSSERVIVYRGIRISDKLPVVIKILANEYPTQEDVARLKHEFEILTQLNFSYVIKPLGIEKVDHRYALVMEDTSFMTLSEFMQKQKINLDLFFKIAKQLAFALHEIHNAHVIHKDINPSNILIGQDGEQIKIIDFHISTLLFQERQEIKSPEGLEGTLAYMSPEQTGRINRSVDRRTDLYSLGITFYQMLTNRLPFEAKSPIEWVHSHIAKQPKPPHEINLDIPVAISNIVMKLLAKAPEERYSTAFGLMADIEQAISSWLRKRSIDIFPLGEKDKTALFQIPQKLYGREIEIEQLLAAFQRVNSGSRQLLLVCGYSGIGKTSLVNELHRPIVKQHGYFVSGKCEKFQQERPLYGLIQAFQHLIQQLLTGSTEQIAYWRQKLSDVLYPNAQVIIDVIPEMENLIGKQPPVHALPPSEARNRFELVFFDFVHAFANAEHPTVIFLDDVQWADLASMDLIKQFMRDESLTYFLLICAYRDNEVTKGHPLLDMLNVLEQNNVPIEKLQVRPLDLANVNRLVVDTIHTNLDIAPLSELVHEKTGGNPFFVNTFLQKLYDEKFLTFDIKQAEWLWDISTLKALTVTDNVTDMVVEKMTKLPPDTKNILKLAACVGNQFDLSALSLAQEKSPFDVANILWPLLEINLVVPLSDGYRYISAEANYTHVRQVIYKFSHDRIHQAALSMLSPIELSAINLKLARFLSANLPPAEQEERLFEIVNHFNISLEYIINSAERLELANLNFKAGCKAKASIAYDSAAKYFEHTMQLLGENAWDKHYQLMFEASMLHAECMHLTGSFTEADKLFSALMDKATNKTDRARVIMLQTLSYTMQLKRQKAIDICLKGLETLGMQAARKPNPLKIVAELFKVLRAVRKKSVDDLLNIPPLTEPDQKLIMEFIDRLTVSAYLEDPHLMALTGLKGLLFSLKNGYAASTSIHFILLALMLIAVFRNYDRAYQYGQLAMKIADRFDDMRIRTTVYFQFNVLIAPWKLPYRKCCEALEKVYPMGRQSGELLYASYAASMITQMMLVQGDPLSDIEVRIKNFYAIPEFIKNLDVICNFGTFERMISVLKGEKPVDYFHEHVTEFLENRLTYLHPIAYVISGIMCLTTSYILEDWENALIILQKTKPYADAEYMVAILHRVEYYFFASLIYLVLYEKQGRWERFKTKLKLKSNLRKLASFAKTCPHNFLSKYQLVRGGMLHLAGHLDEAMKAYDLAIRSARENNLLPVEAIINEFIGRFFYFHQMQKQAKLYTQEAALLYQIWGATWKVKALQEHYPDLFIQSRALITSGSKTDTTTTTATDTLQLDLSSIMKSTQTISSKVKWEELVHALIKIAMENAGASRGFLLLIQDEKLLIAARCDSPDAEPELLQHVPANEFKDLCLSLVQYVFNTGQTILLDNASITAPYSQDAYVMERKPLSIVCVPILREAKVLGMLYLENNLTPGAFSSQRTEILTLLAGQAAISIENAQLYSAYDQFVPHEFLDILGKRRIIDVHLGDQIQKEMGVLFSDIRGFTALSEKLSPAANFEFINEYLRFMEPAIRENGGFIDKFIGDAIMALFPGGADNVVSAGVAMQKALEKYNVQRVERNLTPISIGIGINYGKLILGTVGSRYRMETTVISDTVNQSSRIEDLTKMYQSRLLISDATYKAMKNPDLFQYRFIDRIQIRGKEEISDIWEVYSADSDQLYAAKLAIAAHYNHAIKAFYKGDYKNALNLFQRCGDKLSSDKVIQVYVERCTRLIKEKKEEISSPKRI